jgi:hypothetical protein
MRVTWLRAAPLVRDGDGHGAAVLDDEFVPPRFVGGEVVDFQAVDGGGEFDRGLAFVDQAGDGTVAIEGELHAGVFEHAGGERGGGIARAVPGPGRSSKTL